MSRLLSAFLIGALVGLAIAGSCTRTDHSPAVPSVSASARAVVAAEALLAEALRGIMAADRRLAREVAAGYPAGSGAYRMAILATPSLTGAWQVQFSGRYLGVRIMILEDARVFAPVFSDDRQRGA